MPTPPVPPAFALPPPSEVSIEAVAAARVFYSRDYVPERDLYRPREAAEQIAGFYGAMIFA